MTTIAPDHDRPAPLVGRDAERRALERFVTEPRDGPANLGVLGGVGSGKTALFDDAVEAAARAGVTVVVLRPRANEAAISWVGIRDLVDQVGDPVLRSLRPQHAAALRSVVDPTVDDGPAPMSTPLVTPTDPVSSTDPVTSTTAAEPTRVSLAIPAATLALLEAAAAAGPTLLAIDDLHRLDDASARALSFAVRRCPAPLRVLWTRPSTVLPEGPASFGDHGDRIELGVLADHHIRQIAAAHQTARIDRTISDLLVERADGSPLLARELARAASDGSFRTGHAVDPSIDSLLSERLSTLTVEARTVIDALGCSTGLTVAQLASILSAVGAGSEPTAAAEVVGAVEAAEDAGIIQLTGGAAHFVHDAWRRSVYDGLEASRRRALHRSIAAVIGERSESVRHRLLGTVRASPDLLAEVDSTAAALAARGAPGGAAALLELALASAPDDRSTRDRQTTAARYRIAVGDLDRAMEMLGPVLADRGAGPDAWARAAGLRALQRLLRGDIAGAARSFEEAVDAATEPATLTWANLNLAFVLTNTSRLTEARVQLHKVESMGFAIGPEVSAALHATIVMVDVLCGKPVDWGRLDAAVEAEARHGPADVPVTSRPALIRALMRRTAGQLTAALEDLDRVRSQVMLDGDDTALNLTDLWAAGMCCELGRLDRAADLVATGADRTRLVGGSEAWVVAAEATVAAWQGDDDRTRRRASLAVDALGIHSPLTAWPLAAQAHVALARNDLKAALAAHETLARHARGVGLSPGPAQWWTPDMVEVLSGLGLADRAASELDGFDVGRLGPEAVDARAVDSRCRGLLAAARGDLYDAEHHLRAAIAVHTDHDGRIGRARAELHLGAVLRRLRRRSEARTHLAQAELTFRLVGADAWADRARSELDRLGGKTRGPGPLTNTERRVASLVADGLTNREIADALCVSTKTVEAHLTRIYRSADVRSRTGLVALRPNRPDLFD